EKMSKSLGNFILTRDLLQSYDPKVIRFFMLSVHYRNPINFTEELLRSAESSLERITTAYQNLEHRKKTSMNLVDHDQEWIDKMEQLKSQFEQEMDDDFNTANAISVLFELAKEANMYIELEQTSSKVIDAFQETIR